MLVLLLPIMVDLQIQYPSNSLTMKSVWRDIVTLTVLPFYYPKNLRLVFMSDAQEV